MRSLDEMVILEHSSQCLQKIKQKHLERYEKIKKKQKTWVRISKFLLSSSNTLTFMVNLPNKIQEERISKSLRSEIGD